LTLLGTEATQLTAPGGDFTPILAAAQINPESALYF
jgi:hypothetical protein